MLFTTYGTIKKMQYNSNTVIAVLIPALFPFRMLFHGWKNELHDL